VETWFAKTRDKIDKKGEIETLGAWWGAIYRSNHPDEIHRPTDQNDPVTTAMTQQRAQILLKLHYVN